MIFSNAGMTYARFFPSDWRTGCLTLNLEEEGLYVRVCMFMYDTGTALVDNDVKASQLLRVQIQKYQKVMGSLIAKGKIIRAQGVLINERVVEEFDRWKLSQAARSEAAKKREARKEHLQREVAEALAKNRAEAEAKAATPPPTPGGTPRGTPRGTPGGDLGVPPYVPHVVTHKNINEINGPNTTVVPEPWHNCASNPESIVHSPERKKETTTTVEAARNPNGGGDISDRLNGSAAALQAFIERHANVDPYTARDMLANNVKAFTAEALLEAHSITLGRMAVSFLAQPYPYFLETARKLKEGRLKAAAARKAFKPSKYGAHR